MNGDSEKPCSRWVSFLVLGLAAGVVILLAIFAGRCQAASPIPSGVTVTIQAE